MLTNALQLPILPDVQVAAQPSSAAASRNNFGFDDYTAVDFYNKTFYPAWGDNSNSTGDNPNPLAAGANRPSGPMNVYTAAVHAAFVMVPAPPPPPPAPAAALAVQPTDPTAAAIAQQTALGSNPPLDAAPTEWAAASADTTPGWNMDSPSTWQPGSASASPPVIQPASDLFAPTSIPPSEWKRWQLIAQQGVMSGDDQPLDYALGDSQATDVDASIAATPS